MLKRKNSDSDENGAKRAAVQLSMSSPLGGDSPRGEPSDHDMQGSAVEMQTSESGPNAARVKAGTIVSSHKLNVVVDPSTFIHIRLLVSLKEAVTIIGRGGSTIAKIREASGIRLNVSDHLPGITERVVNLKGSAEHVAKVCRILWNFSTFTN